MKQKPIRKRLHPTEANLIILKKLQSSEIEDLSVAVCAIIKF